MQQHSSEPGGVLEALDNLIDTCEKVGGPYEAVVYNWPYFWTPDGKCVSFLKRDAL